MNPLRPFLLTTTSLVLCAGLYTPVSSQIITTQPPANTVTVINAPLRVVPSTAGQPTAISPNIIPGKDPVSPNIIPPGKPSSSGVRVLNAPLRVVPPTAGQPTAISPNIIPGKDPVSPNIIPPGKPPVSPQAGIVAPNLAVFTCNGQSLAGAFSGGIAGIEIGTPFSEFLFVTINGDGTLTTFEVLGTPGNVAQTVSGTGSWSIFDATNCFALATFKGKKFVLHFADGGNMILFSTPFDPNVQASGFLRRSGM